MGKKQRRKGKRDKKAKNKNKKRVWVRGNGKKTQRKNRGKRIEDRDRKIHI